MKNCSRWRVNPPTHPLEDDIYSNCALESEKEQYNLAIGTSILLTFLFAYDGIVMGFPQLSFWTYLVLPHVLLATVVVGVIWRKGMFHRFPVAYVVGFAAFLALAMVHQHGFVRNHHDWKGNHRIS